MVKRTKICTQCGEEKARSEYYLGNVLKDGTRGVMAACKICTITRTAAYNKLHAKDCRERVRKHYYSHLESERKRQRESHRNGRRMANRFNLSLREGKKTSLKKGYAPCSATAEEIENAFTGFCQNPDCGIMENDIKLCMDHDHETGEFRGWLCRACNARDALANPAQKHRESIK